MYPSFYINTANTIRQHTNKPTYVLSINYDLSHKKVVPHQLLQATHAYDYLTQRLNISADSIIIGGDSAGLSNTIQTIFVTFIHTLVVSWPNT